MSSLRRAPSPAVVNASIGKFSEVRCYQIQRTMNVNLRTCHVATSDANLLFLFDLFPDFSQARELAGALTSLPQF